MKLCRNGLHAMVGDNVVQMRERDRSYRTCRECRRAYMRERARQRRTHKRLLTSAASVKTIDPAVVLYREELKRYQAKQAEKMKVVHEEVQRRVQAISESGWAFHMLNDAA